MQARHSPVGAAIFQAETLGNVIALAAITFGDKIAFEDERRKVSFNGFRDEVDMVANALFACGLRKGDRVAIVSRNCVEVVTLLSLSRAGLVPVPLNWRLPEQELARLIVDADAGALFYQERYRPIVEQVELECLPKDRIFSIGQNDAGHTAYYDLVARGRTGRPERTSGSDPCCLLYTSGTTGAPKGVVLRHASAVSSARDVAWHAFAFVPNDITLMAMPLFHVGGIWYYLFPSFMSGCTTVIHDMFDPDRVVAALRFHKVTNIHIVPTMLADLLSHPDFMVAAVTLRLIVYAGSSMPSHILQRAMDALPHCDFSQAYGSTEGGSITALGPEDHRMAVNDPAWEHVLRSCGRPIGDVEVRIEPHDDRSSEPMGEILIRSSKLMASYWHRPDETADKLVDGWLRTGDVGHQDRNGYLYIVDRKNDMIISGGENVFPFEVEEVLRQHDAVAEAAVFGVPDPRWVEKLVAAVVVKDEATLEPDDLIAFARARLGGYKTPKSVLILPSLPKSAVGKVLRKELRAEYSDLL